MELKIRKLKKNRKEPYMTTPVKVYPTSIVSSAPLEPIRDAKYVASSTVVEVVHIITFALVLSFIFGKAWKFAVRNEKKVNALSPEAATQKA
jgi:hypothetical protein